jgi:hypothetical protein
VAADGLAIPRPAQLAPDRGHRPRRSPGASSAQATSAEGDWPARAMARERPPHARPGLAVLIPDRWRSRRTDHEPSATPGPRRPAAGWAVRAGERGSTPGMTPTTLDLTSRRRSSMPGRVAAKIARRLRRPAVGGHCPAGRCRSIRDVPVQRGRVAGEGVEQHCPDSHGRVLRRPRRCCARRRADTGQRPPGWPAPPTTCWRQRPWSTLPMPRRSPPPPRGTRHGVALTFRSGGSASAAGGASDLLVDTWRHFGTRCSTQA